ncbi:MAG TPA: hypothetical protein PLS63_06305 [Microthrixaceae bacterium]|jgi:hypothetical protein|nr:hypothetical protein [Microthrixaceae bacterium]
MALTHKHRSALYEGLSEIVDEEAVNEMLAYFPTRDGDEPISKDFLRAELLGIRAEMSDLRTAVKDDISRALIVTIVANIGVMVAFAAVIVAAVRL